MAESRTKHTKAMSRRAARTWLFEQNLPRTEGETRLLMEAVARANRMKSEAEASLAEWRRYGGFIRAVEELRAKYPDLVETHFSFPAGSWKNQACGLRFFRSLPAGDDGFKKYTSAMARFFTDLEKTKRERVWAVILLTAARAAGLRDPSPTEAVVVAVAVGVEEPVRFEAEYATRVNTWERRLDAVTKLVDELLNPAPLPIEHATYFGGDYNADEGK